MSEKINKETFSVRLKSLMESRNETVYTLGELLHLSPASISRYSSGAMSPKTTTVEMLAMHFNINPAWLMGYDVDQNYPNDISDNNESLDLGKKIKALRIKKGLTQEELGNLLGLKIAAIQKYENGSVENVKRATIKMLAEIFGVTPAYLMGWEEDPKENIIEEALEERIKIVARKADGIPKEDLEMLMQMFDNTLDIYLKGRSKN